MRECLCLRTLWGNFSPLQEPRIKGNLLCHLCICSETFFPSPPHQKVWVFKGLHAGISVPTRVSDPCRPTVSCTVTAGLLKPKLLGKIGKHPGQLRSGKWANYNYSGFQVPLGF